ncbi:hypothetical protein Cgig2_004156 [Carnegiea gigantea]|uniref:RST domain-containing protein n=1 Tax=Carnegiea gigantea TaxID=171969 RepID=A0A9Q1QPL7_9CARY|nr:hypothetical protein Cgig2_004156 [Carnegiea gigantea]
MEDQIQFNENILPHRHLLVNYSSDSEFLMMTRFLIVRVRLLVQSKEIESEDYCTKGIKRRLVSNLGYLGNETTVVAVHRKNWLGCFGILAHAFAGESHGGGVANVVKYAWFGGSKEEITRIMSHGFDHRDIREHGGLELCLSPIECPAQRIHIENCCYSMIFSTKNTDPIDYASSQFHLNSDEFDLEIDDVGSPRKYTIWSANMNTHILPEYVVTFTAPPCLMGSNSSSRRGLRVKRQPKSPWMPLQALISALSRILPPRAINVIKKHHKDLKDRKISLLELVQKKKEN